MNTLPPLALYVHLPWCIRKCPYCDFNSHALKSAAPDPGYMDALLRDFDLDAPLVRGRSIDSVFFGGGTPSLFPPESFASLLSAVKSRIDFRPDAEVTLEANPGTLERGRFTGYRQAGINRVSLGAQTFSAAALERLGRIHTPSDTLRAATDLRDAGIENFNLDLMYALPNQTIDEALADVAAACELGPAHLSHYQLTLEPGTAFHACPPTLPDEDSAWEMQVECQRLLAQAGYAQYEVSAYAQSGARCRHNLNYWQFGDYLGLGAGAHGKITLGLPDRILRTAKPKQPRAYRESIAAATEPVGEREFTQVNSVVFEFMLNALRLNEGFGAQLFEQRTGLAFDALAEPFARAQQRGLVEPTASGWRPSEFGRRFLNELQAAFIT